MSFQESQPVILDLDDTSMEGVDHDLPLDGSVAAPRPCEPAADNSSNFAESTSAQFIDDEGEPEPAAKRKQYTTSASKSDPWMVSKHVASKDAWDASQEAIHRQTFYNSCVIKDMSTAVLSTMKASLRHRAGDVTTYVEGLREEIFMVYDASRATATWMDVQIAVFRDRFFTARRALYDDISTSWEETLLAGVLHVRGQVFYQAIAKESLGSGYRALWPVELTAIYQSTLTTQSMFLMGLKEKYAEFYDPLLFYKTDFYKALQKKLKSSSLSTSTSTIVLGWYASNYLTDIVNLLTSDQWKVFFDLSNEEKDEHLTAMRLAQEL
jgi:hypothetical protein